jgi:hypothetical protein
VAVRVNCIPPLDKLLTAFAAIAAILPSLSSESFISLSSSSFLSTFFTTERIFDVVGESSLSFLIWPVAGMEEGVVACEGQRDCKCRQRK